MALEARLPGLPKTLFFEYLTLRSIAGYLAAARAAEMELMLLSPIGERRGKGERAMFAASRRSSAPTISGIPSRPLSQPLPLSGERSKKEELEE